PACLCRRQKQNQIRDLFRLANSADGVRGFAAFHESGIGVFTHSRVSMKIRSHDSWIDPVHTHTLRRKLQGGASGELIDGGLADAVSEHVRKCAKSSYTGNMHNIPFSFGTRW